MTTPTGPPPGVSQQREGVGARARFRDAVVVLGVAALLILPPLGQRTISTSHEARFAVLAQDMLERGAWLEARVGGEVYRNKPPLFPWSIAALSWPRGRVTETTAQAPVAAAAIATALVTFLLGARLFGRRAGLWAALILLTSYDFFAHSQLILPDMLVAAFTTAAGYALWRAAAAAPPPWAMAAFYAALGFGVFAKGPVGLLPLLVGGIWLWSEEGARGLRRLWSPAGIALFLLVTAGWLAPFLAHGPWSFTRKVVWRDWLDWFVGLPSPRHLAAFALESVAGFMPWTLVLPLALAAVVRGGRSPATRFVLAWLVAPFLLIALSNNPRARYLLPIYPAAALLVAGWAETHAAAPSRAGRVLGRPALLVHGAIGATLVVFTVGIWLYTGWVNRTHDVRRVVAMLSTHARGEPAAAYFNRAFFQIDFYLGRPLRQIRTVQELNEYAAGPARPAVLVNGRNWDFIRDHRSPGLRVVDGVRLGDEDILLVAGRR